MLDDIAVNVEKDYSHNKEALKVDYLVGLPSLTSRGEQVPEHGHDACTVWYNTPESEPLRHCRTHTFRHIVITAFKIRLE